MLIAQIIGNLGRDAEVKHIGERDYLSFSVASTERQGEQETTTWVSILASHNPNLLPFLKKGQQVFVSGRMSVKIYQSQQNFGIDISIFAQTLQLCGGKREEAVVPAASPSGQSPAPTSVQSVAVSQQPSTAPFPPPVDENGNPKDPDDLPF